MSSVRLTARNRTERLTNKETVRLGRLLRRTLAIRHVSYPDEAVVVVLYDHRSLLAPDLAKKVADIIGEFDQGVESE